MWGEALTGCILRCRKNSSCLRKWQEDNEQYREPQSRLDYWRNLMSFQSGLSHLSQL